MKVTEKKLGEFARDLNTARATVFVAAQALGAGDGDDVGGAVDERLGVEEAAGQLFVVAGRAHDDGERLAANEREQLFALFGRQLFGIVDALDEALGREDYGGGDDRAGHRTNARLIDAGDRGESVFPEAPFVAQVRPLTHIHCPAILCVAANPSHAQRRSSDYASDGVECKAFAEIIAKIFPQGWKTFCVADSIGRNATRAGSS